MAVTLKAQVREDHNKAATKAIREKGHIPAVVYGNDKESKSISVDTLQLLKTVRDEGRNSIISLDVESDKPVDVMLHDYQKDPLRDELLHADFLIVNMSEEMDVEVPLRLDGEATGSKEGGVLQQPFYELQVRAKPANIPDEISVDISNLEVGDSIAIADLPQSDVYAFIDDPETTIATVIPPDTVEDVEESSDESQEPELVGEDKEKE